MLRQTLDNLTQVRLKALLQYNTGSGDLIWRPRGTDKNRGWNIRFAGKRAGSLQTYSRRSYLRIRISGADYQAHRLVWLYVYGVFPNGDLDHIDGDGLNNRICNLRDTTRGENLKNSQINVRNTSGVTGVYWSSARGKWIAQLSSEGKVYNLGGFIDKEEAIEARLAANVKYGFHVNHGRKERVAASQHLTRPSAPFILSQ